MSSIPVVYFPREAGSVGVNPGNNFFRIRAAVGLKQDMACIKSIARRMVCQMAVSPCIAEIDNQADQGPGQK